MGAIAANPVVSWTDSDGGDHDGSLVTRAKGFDVIACAICGFRHVIPLPDAAELEHAYRDTYDTGKKPVLPTDAGEDREWAALASSDRLESFEQLLPPERRRLLDVGCGPGSFLQTARERGWSGQGLEPSPQAPAPAR